MLDLSSSKIGDAGLAALAGSPHLHQLERLAVQSNQFGIAGLRVLVAAFPSLRALAIQLDGRAQLRVLVESDPVARLECLEITGSQLDDRAIAPLVVPRWPALKRLSLYSNRIGPAGAKAIAKSPSFPVLAALDLGHNAIGDDGARAIVTSSTLELATLRLRANRIARAGIRALATSRALAHLEELDLSANQLRDEDIAILATAKVPALRRLNLDWNPLTAGAAVALASWSVKLEELILSDPVDQYGADESSGIGDDGARALASSKKLAGLRRLNLSANRIGDDGALAIATSPHLEKLEWLELRWNHLGTEGVRAIANQFGKRASAAYQRTESPARPPPRTESTPNTAPPPAPAERRRVLGRLAKKRAFSAWKPSLDKPVVDAAETIARETAEALLALGAKPTRAAESKLLRRYVSRFDALDARDHFIGTIEVEDVGERFDELRFATALSDDDSLFDAWRDF